MMQSDVAIQKFQAGDTNGQCKQIRNDLFVAVGAKKKTTSDVDDFLAMTMG